MGVNGFFRHTGRGEEGGLLRRILGLAVFALLLSALPLSAQAADGVRIDVAEKDGYGRAIFTFPDGVPEYRASINSGILVLDFDRTFDVEPDVFLRQMPRYVAIVRQSEDRRSPPACADHGIHARYQDRRKRALCRPAATELDRQSAAAAAGSSGTDRCGAGSPAERGRRETCGRGARHRRARSAAARSFRARGGAGRQ